MTSANATSNSDNRSTRRPKKSVATGLSILCPGLGYLYIGDFKVGILTNVVFVLALAGFVLLFDLLTFFPGLPLLVIAASWLVFTALVIQDVRARIDAHEGPFEEESYNHWTIYGGVFLLAYVLPVGAVVVFTNSFLVGFEKIESARMFPNVKPGDTVLIEKNAYRSKKPKPGDLVALKFPGTDTYRILRVVANGGSRVQIAANTVYVGERELPQMPLDEHEERATSPDGDFELWVEQNGGAKYVVSLLPSAVDEPTFRTQTLAEDELYLLSDNRSRPSEEERSTNPGDSREFGPVRSDAVAGKPLYIAWSTSPQTGEIRWDRIGLRLQ
mgnify:CR=1 FL=1